MSVTCTRKVRRAGAMRTRAEPSSDRLNDVTHLARSCFLSTGYIYIDRYIQLILYNLAPSASLG